MCTACYVIVLFLILLFLQNIELEFVLTKMVK